ncbi:MAG TPA: RnfABCDGE type electron transport complex subunit D [Terriglobia bacterium]|jgi:Na+-translocating ferredoxin:NAD+ oxidoreductase RnfD subunit
MVNGAVARFLWTPKGLLLTVLALLTFVAARHEPLDEIGPLLISAIAAAGVIDVFILRRVKKAWEFPSGAVLTGLIIAMVLSPYEPWYVAAATSAIAVVSKYVFRSRFANIFNPAALAIVITFYIFDTGQSWWGALPEIEPFAIVLLFITGGFIANRVNKVPMVLIFLGLYYLLFTVTSFLGNPAHAAEIYRAPDLHAVLYFAFFILTDPPTSPVKYPHQLCYGAIVAVTSYAFFELVGAVYYLLAAVLVGNLWEAGRRWFATQR